MEFNEEKGKLIFQTLVTFSCHFVIIIAFKIAQTRLDSFRFTRNKKEQKSGF